MNIAYLDSSQPKANKLVFIEDNERKDIQIKVRVSQKEKDIIDAYCKQNELSISNFLRLAITKQINNE